MRSRPSKRALTAAIVLGASLLGASSAQACSCVGPDPEAGYASFLEEADGAIIAKLVDVKTIGNGRKASFLYRVLEVYKRPNRFDVGERRRVVSATDSAACGIGYPVGSTHGVFLYRQRGHFTSSLCSTISSKEMREAAEVASGERPDRTHPSGEHAAAAESGACLIVPSWSGAIPARRLV